MTDHQKLRELAQNATPGPWELDSLENGEHGIFIDQERSEAEGLGCGGNQVACFMTGANARYLVELAPETVLALLNELEDVRAEKQRTDVALRMAWDEKATLIQQVRNQAAELEDVRAAYQSTRHQLDAHRAGRGAYGG